MPSFCQRFSVGTFTPSHCHDGPYNLWWVFPKSMIREFLIIPVELTRKMASILSSQCVSLVSSTLLRANRERVWHDSSSRYYTRRRNTSVLLVYQLMVSGKPQHSESLTDTNDVWGSFNLWRLQLLGKFCQLNFIHFLLNIEENYFL